MASSLDKQVGCETRSMGQLHALLRAFLTESGPTTIDDAIKAIDVCDPFAQAVLRRTFIETLKPGKPNEDLTRDGKWLRVRDDWSAAEGIEKGKSTRVVQQRTAASVKIEEKAKELGGVVSEDAIEAALTAANILADRGNRKLTEAAGDLLAEQTTTLLSELKVVVKVAEERALRLQDAARHEEHLREALALMKQMMDERMPPKAAE